MTTKKVRQALDLVEAKVKAFNENQTRKNLEDAIEEIQDFHRTIGVLLWDEEKCLADTWQNKSKEENTNVR